VRVPSQGRYNGDMIMPRRTPQEAKRVVLRAEAVGILIILVIGFILILVRYGRFIDWHVR
jgi:hypothetical protein